MAKISIVTSFFSETIDMVEGLYENVKRSNVDWEWIVTNDFSDNPDLEDKLTDISGKDVRVRKIIQKTKLEVFRNPSLYADGDFIFHIDGDDRFNPVYLEHALIWFKRFPEVICIISGCRWVSYEGLALRYFIDEPFVFPHKKNGINYPHTNYTGRIWRNNIKLVWEDIFSNPQDIIRLNDHYIVEFLSTKGDILHLPRIYIEYFLRNNSNSRIQRTEEEIKKIDKTNEEFSRWRMSQRKDFTRFPYFFSGEDEFQKELQPFLKIDWKYSGGKVGVVGFSKIPAKRKMLSQLYPEFIFLFDPLPEESQDVIFWVFCNIDETNHYLPEKKWYTHFEGEDKKESVFSYLYSNSVYQFFWTEVDDNYWIENLIYT